MLGAIVIGSLPVSLLPEAPIPQVAVQASAPGLSAREVEDVLTRPLRNTLLQVDHLEDISSISRDGAAQISLFFEPGTNTNLSLLEVNEKTDQAATYLPKNIPRPQVAKNNTTDIPIFFLHIFPKDNTIIAGSDEDKLNLAALVQNVIKRRIEQLDEVAFVDVSGYAQPEVFIRPKPEIFNSLQLSEKDLASILQQSRLDLGNVLLQDGHYQYNVRLKTEPNTVEDIRRISFRHEGRLLHLGEIADIGIRAAARQGVCFHNGHESIVLAIRKKAGARIFSLRKSFASLLETFREEYTGLEFVLTNDQSTILDISVKNLGSSLQWGALFAALILLAFFKDWRSPLLISLVIPVSLIIALFGFFIFNISINVISLSGLVLGIGLMIDNSIIIIENIRQYRRMGSSHEEACIEAPEEIIRPLISSALTTCSVFIPLIFLSGLAGALFFDQAASVTLALGASLLTAYLLLPTIVRLSKKWLQHNAAETLEYPRYNMLVDAMLRRPWLSLGIATLLISALLITSQSLKIESFPNITRQGVVLRVNWNEPLSLEESKRRFEQVLSALGEFIIAHDVFLGRQQFLLSENTQTLHQAQAWLYGEADTLRVQTLRLFSEKYPLASIEIEPVKTIFDIIFGGNEPPLVAHFQNVATKETPNIEKMQPILSWLESQNLPYRLPPQQQEYTLNILKEKALVYDIPYEAIVDKLKAIFEEYPLGAIKYGQKELPVVSAWSVGAPDLNRIRLAKVTNRAGQPFPLQQFIRVGRRSVPLQFTAGRSGESFDIKFFTWPGAAFTDSLRNRASQSGQLIVHFSGQHFKDRQQVRELSGIAAVSLLLLYLILAAQFESLLLPFIVILTVPAGVAGSLLALELTGQSLNMVSLTGMVVMGGIVVNDAILKVDMLQRHSFQMPLREAIHYAGARRLRPIVMTSVTTILALLPILFADGLGAELQQPLALAVIGGLTAGTLASLLVVPLLFYLLKGQRS